MPDKWRRIDLLFEWIEERESEAYQHWGRAGYYKRRYNITGDESYWVLSGWEKGIAEDSWKRAKKHEKELFNLWTSLVIEQGKKEEKDALFPKEYFEPEKDFDIKNVKKEETGEEPSLEQIFEIARIFQFPWLGVTYQKLKQDELKLSFYFESEVMGVPLPDFYSWLEQLEDEGVKSEHRVLLTVTYQVRTADNEIIDGIASLTHSNPLSFVLQESLETLERWIDDTSEYYLSNTQVITGIYYSIWYEKRKGVFYE